MNNKIVLVLVALLLLFTFSLSAQEWPTLDLDIWEEMTVEQLKGHLQKKDVNARNEYGQTPLMIASGWNSNPEIVQLLIDNGANINGRDIGGSTPLMYASQHTSNPEVIQLLIDSGANINGRDKNGYTPLMYASAHNFNPEVIQLLINNGANIDAMRENRDTALIIASFHNTPEVVEILVNLSEDRRVNWDRVWELAQQNEKLKGSDVYWRINELQHASQNNSTLYNNPGLYKDILNEYLKYTQ